MPEPVSKRFEFDDGSEIDVTLAPVEAEPPPPTEPPEPPPEPEPDENRDLLWDGGDESSVAVVNPGSRTWVVYDPSIQSKVMQGQWWTENDPNPETGRVDETNPVISYNRGGAKEDVSWLEYDHIEFDVRAKNVHESDANHIRLRVASWDKTDGIKFSSVFCDISNFLTIDELADEEWHHVKIPISRENFWLPKGTDETTRPYPTSHDHTIFQCIHNPGTDKETQKQTAATTLMLYVDNYEVTRGDVVPPVDPPTEPPDPPGPPEPSPDLPESVLAIQQVDARHIALITEVDARPLIGVRVGGTEALVTYHPTRTKFWDAEGRNTKPKQFDETIIELGKDVKRGQVIDLEFSNASGSTVAQYVWMYTEDGDDYDYKPAQAIRYCQTGCITGQPLSFRVGFARDTSPLPNYAGREWKLYTDDNALVHKGVLASRGVKQRNKNGGAIFGDVTAYPENSFETSGLHPGDYYISVQGVGRTPLFRIAPDAWCRAAFIRARHLYHRRIGYEVTEEYSNHPHMACSHGPVHDGELIAPIMGDTFLALTDSFGDPMPRRSIDASRYGIKHFDELDYGLRWHMDDADGDMQWQIRYFQGLLHSYLENPAAFTKDQWNIPNDGFLPDVLGEAHWWLRGWRQMIDEIGCRAVRVEAGIHSVSYEEPQHELHWCTGPATRPDCFQWATIMGLMAMCIEVISSEVTVLADSYKATAIKAFEEGIAKAPLMPHFINAEARMNYPPDDQYPDFPEGIKRGDEYKVEVTDEFCEKHAVDALPYEIQARAIMWKLGYEKDHQNRVISELRPNVENSPIVGVYRDRSDSEWFLYFVAKDNIGGLTREVETFTDPANKILSKLAENDYPCAYSSGDPAYGKYASKHAATLMCAYWLTKQEKYRAGAIKSMTFVYGVNPLGMCWISHVGQKGPEVWQHGMFQTIRDEQGKVIEQRDLPKPEGDFIYGPSKGGGDQDLGYFQRWTPATKGLAQGNEGPWGVDPIWPALALMPIGWMPTDDDIPHIVENIFDKPGTYYV